MTFEINGKSDVVELPDSWPIYRWRKTHAAKPKIKVTKEGQPVFDFDPYAELGEGQEVEKYIAQRLAKMGETGLLTILGS